MFRTLYGRLLVVILAFGLALTTIFIIILLVYHEAYHTEADQTVNRRLAQQYADARLLITDEPLTVDNFHKGIEKLGELNPDLDIYLLAAGGEIVASSVSSRNWARRRVNLAPVESFLKGISPLPIFGDDPRSARGREIFSAAPVAIKDCPASYLYVVLHREHHQSAVRQLRTAYTINESVGLLISCGILAVGATLVLVRSITQRLSRLRADMERFQATTMRTAFASRRRLPESATDEIERLAMMFRDLSSQVQSQMEALQTTDDMRRSMVANISHDLRTPLTTLQVHLDTLLLKDAELPPSERRDYLTTAANQCRRLAHLVAQLLELAGLDAGQVVPQMEPFQLAELMQDIVQKLRLHAASKQISLHREHPDDLPLVRGDISLIERVMDNLTENAIQHSSAGTVVTLRATLGNPGAVRFEVEDSGSGIPPEDQARIFERFYRGDQSRSSGSAHAGLGLAIVKGILDLHGIAITVRSQPGKGSLFSFEIPVQPAHIDGHIPG